MKHQQAILLLAGILVILTAAAVATSAVSEGPLRIGNPWQELPAETLWETTGVRMNIPAEATDIHYRYLATFGTAEVQFVLEDAHWNARIQPSDVWQDISGLYYTWTHSKPCMLPYGEVQLLQARDGSQFVTLCQFFSEGHMYALSSIGEIDRLPCIEALAQLLFTPAEASDAPTAADLQNLFRACTGYAGSSGSSLKEALAAIHALTFAADHHTADAHPNLLSTSLQSAWLQLDDAQQEELRCNLPRIHTLILCLQHGGDAAEARFQDAGVSQATLNAAREGIPDWLAMYPLLESLLNTP